MHPDLIGTELQLHTQQTLNAPEILSYSDKSSIQRSKYDKRYPLKIIIHGLKTAEQRWILRMADALIARVCIVWEYKDSILELQFDF